MAPLSRFILNRFRFVWKEKQMGINYTFEVNSKAPITQETCLKVMTHDMTYDLPPLPFLDSASHSSSSSSSHTASFRCARSTVIYTGINWTGINWTGVIWTEIIWTGRSFGLRSFGLISFGLKDHLDW